jgi:hypothetical protein
VTLLEAGRTFLALGAVLAIVVVLLEWLGGRP